jgi:hypothetical protein
MLGYGCVLVKFGKKIQQLKKLHIMVIVSLLITSLLLIEQLG